MAESGREARRRRILHGSQDRLALITGRKPDPGSSPPFDPPPPPPPPLIHHQPSVSQNEEDSATDLAAKLSQEDGFDRSREQSFPRTPNPSNNPLRAPTSEYQGRREPPSPVQRAIVIASDAVLQLARQIPIGNVTSQQVSAAVQVTEHDRFVCALTIAILVVLSYAGFPIVGSKIFRLIILFRPLFLVLVTNITLIVRRLLPDNQKNLGRGDNKEINTSFLGDGYAWAEEAGRALELGLMLQNILGAMFLDCSVYATIVVVGLSLFG